MPTLNSAPSPIAPVKSRRCRGLACVGGTTLGPFAGYFCATELKSGMIPSPRAMPLVNRVDLDSLELSAMKQTSPAHSLDNKQSCPSRLQSPCVLMVRCHSAPTHLHTALFSTPPALANDPRTVLICLPMNGMSCTGSGSLLLLSRKPDAVSLREMAWTASRSSERRNANTRMSSMYTQACACSPCGAPSMMRLTKVWHMRGE